MPSAYEQQDKERLAPAMAAVRAFMYETGWHDLDRVAKFTGLRVGTVASKLRELCDKDHSYLGLAYERRRVKGGVHEYRLMEREPAQMPLFGEAAA